MYSFSLATVKGNGTESVLSARYTQPFTFPGISCGENFSTSAADFTRYPLLLGEQRHHGMRSLPNTSTLEYQCSFTSLATNNLVTIIVWFSLATSSQSLLTFPCYHQSDTADFSLRPSVRHGWLLPCHHIPCHQCLERLVPLPPMF